MSFLDKFFGPTYEKELKEIKPLINAINNKEAALEALSSDELKASFLKLKESVTDAASLDGVLADAFAHVREAAKRTMGMRHYDVQLIGGIILHRGKITEMRTGEGKTLVGTLPA